MGLRYAQDLAVDLQGPRLLQASPPPLPLPVAQVQASVQGPLVGEPLAEVVVRPALPVKGEDPVPQGEDRGLRAQKLHTLRLRAAGDGVEEDLCKAILTGHFIPPRGP